MKANLHIRDFGPIRDCQLMIHEYTILIGPQGAGKSTISKVLAIIHTFDFFTIEATTQARKMAALRDQLRFYRIGNYLQSDTYWMFEDEYFRFELTGEQISVTNKQSLDATAKRLGAYYLPAERIALPMINESLFELGLSDTTLPRYFLEFGKDFTLARQRQTVFNLPQLKIEYAHLEGRNRIYLGPNRAIGLEEASSAIQANLPLLVIMQYPEKQNGVFVIEELELHGYPLLQKQLLYYVVERMRHPKLRNSYVVLPTHSPYILSAANNLLFATKVAKQRERDTTAVEAIITKDAWISPDEFAAYYIKDGKAESIVDHQTGLIAENMLDKVSEALAEEFDALAELYKPAKA